MRRYFLDTNALLDYYDRLDEIGKFMISNLSTTELNSIKDSPKKDMETKIKAQSVLGFLNKHMDTYEVVVVSSEHYNILDQSNLPLTNDNLIVACAYTALDLYNIIFLSGDLGCVNTAGQYFKLKCQTSISENVEPYSGIHYVECKKDNPDDIIKDIDLSWLVENEYVLLGEWKLNKQYDQEQFRMFKGYKYRLGQLMDINKSKLGDLDILFKDNYEQQLIYDAINDNYIDIIVVHGNAGTGKNFGVFANAIHNVKQSFKKRSIQEKSILYTRNLLESGERLGYLPGNIDEKTSPYFSPARQNIDKILEVTIPDRETFKDMMDKEQYFEYPLSFVRGMTFDNCYLVFDEAANASVNDLKTFISRAGKNSKVIIIGSFNQIDRRGNTYYHNGLYELIKRYNGQKNFACIRLNNQQRSFLARQADQLL